MRRRLIPPERTLSQSRQPHHPPSPARLLPHSQSTGLPGSRDSLGSVLSETIATVYLVHPYYHMPWAISAFQDSRNDLISKPPHPLVSC